MIRLTNQTSFDGLSHRMVEFEHGEYVRYFDYLSAVNALKDVIKFLEDDPESFRIGEPSCRSCTSGVTPFHLDKGPCPYHRAKATLHALGEE